MSNLIPLEFKNQRVLTTKQLAQVYKTTESNISNNFNNNIEHFKMGTHYYLIEGQKLSEFKRDSYEIGIAPNTNKLYLWTERGANRHCKILDTDKAWEQFDNLEEIYFRAKKLRQLSHMELLELQYKALKDQGDKLDKVTNKVECLTNKTSYLENNMVIDHGQEVSIKKAVDKQIIRVCFGSEAPAYANKDLRNRIYRALWRDYRTYFNITSYHDTLKKDFSSALRLVNTWKPVGGLLREIQISNNQLSIEKGLL